MGAGNRLVAAGCAFETVATGLTGHYYWSGAGAALLTLCVFAEFTEIAGNMCRRIEAAIANQPKPVSGASSESRLQS